MKKCKTIIVGFAIFAVLMLSMVLLNIKKDKYNIDMLISNYDLSNFENEDKYINYLKKYIYPLQIRNFIDNDFVPTNLLGNDDTGNEMVELMKFIGYKSLFTSMFDKDRTNFDDCPVTENFKEKYNTNLLYYYGLNASDDCDIICSLDINEKSLIIEVYGDLKNTEPTYWKTHHFHYTLDGEGNVDDVIFDYTE